MLTNHFAPSIAEKLDQLLSGPEALWVTDADGTLWRDDIGEGFLQRLAADGALVSPEAQGVDVWARYEELVAQDKFTGYCWAVQVMEGMRVEDAIMRADAFAREFVESHLHPEMVSLMELARSRGCPIAIVSASGQLIVDAAARVLGIPPERAIGIRTAVRNGVLTKEIVPPVTFKPGKVDAIQKYLGRTPVLVSGDSSGDVEMMLMPGALGLLMARPGKTDPALIELGERSGWLMHAVKSG